MIDHPHRLSSGRFFGPPYNWLLGEASYLGMIVMGTEITRFLKLSDVTIKSNSSKIGVLYSTKN
jgi:hypothetical protein